MTSAAGASPPAEDVIVDGTLPWPSTGVRLVTELATAGYEYLLIIDVEAPAKVACERALERWWT